MRYTKYTFTPFFIIMATVSIRINMYRSVFLRKNVCQCFKEKQPFLCLFNVHSIYNSDWQRCGKQKRTFCLSSRQTNNNKSLETDNCASRNGPKEVQVNETLLNFRQKLSQGPSMVDFLSLRINTDSGHVETGIDHETVDTIPYLPQSVYEGQKRKGQSLLNYSECLSLLFLFFISSLFS